MNRRARIWVRLLARAALAVAVYHGGIVVAFLTMVASRWSLVQVSLHFAFLLVPLQVVYRRNGPRDFLRVSALAFLLLAGLRVALAASALGDLARPAHQSDVVRAMLAPLPGVLYPLVSVELVTVLALLAGLAWVNVYGPTIVPWRAAYRMLAATAAASVLALATIVLLAGNHAFVESLQQLFGNFLEVARSAAARAEMTVPQLGQGASMMQAYWDYLFGSLVFGYFVNLAAAWYLGNRIGARSRYQKSLAAFSLPEVFVWPLIASWTVVLIGRFVKLGHLRAFALNAGLILLALYGVQGLAIIETLVARVRRGPESRRWLLIAVLLALFVPALGVLALVVIPLVGVSEIWIKYRIERKEQTDEGEGDT